MELLRGRRTPDGKLLDTRYAAFIKQLDTIAAGMSGEPRDDVAQLRASIERHYGRYKRTLQAPTAPAPPTPTMKDAYPLDDVLELGRENEQLRRAADLEAQEITLIERSLALGRNEQDAAKLRYRDLAQDSAERTVEGVRLVRDRLRIETLNQELRWRRVHQSALQAELDQHMKLLATAGERIECTSSALAEWQRIEKDAAKAAHNAGADLMKLQLTSSMALATSPDERAQARYHEVKSQRRSVEIAIAEARRATAVLAQRLLQRVAERNTAEPAADRTLLRKQQALLDKQARLATEQRARANQLRSAITIERESSDEPSVGALYDRARNELTGVETALEDLAAQLRSGTQLVDMLDARLRERERAHGPERATAEGRRARQHRRGPCAARRAVVRSQRNARHQPWPHSSRPYPHHRVVGVGPDARRPAAPRAELIRRSTRPRSTPSDACCITSC
ncbi:MAG: hypothetical protein IPM80_00050 [Proteobacteria bacterium]|nr:hypothetical protein [Pseudomonadota bacterium]